MTGFQVAFVHSIALLSAKAITPSCPKAYLLPAYERMFPSDPDRSRLGQGIETRGADPVKALLRILIAELRVNSRNEILPTYRVGAPVVCAQTSSVAVVGGLSNQKIQGALGRLSEKLARLRRGNSAPRPAASQRLRVRRPGWVLTAVVHVLADRGEPMRAKDIHTAVEASLGEPVAWSSIRSALASGASDSSRRLVRVARGRYVLA